MVTWYGLAGQQSRAPRSQFNASPRLQPQSRRTPTPTPRTDIIMAPQQAAQTNTVLDALDITPHPRPFKSPSWKPAARRTKSLKQILSDATRSQTATQNNSGTSTPLLPALSQPIGATYANIESAPSLHPAHSKKWCDITGLPANYTDPKTKLRYTNREVYAAIRQLPPGAADKYLELRGANVILK